MVIDSYFTVFCKLNLYNILTHLVHIIPCTMIVIHCTMHLFYTFTAFVHIYFLQFLLQVYTLMERTELITRQHLRVELLVPGKDLQASIEQDVICDSNVLETWSKIAFVIPPKYEAYSLELLMAVCHLWTSICAFPSQKDATFCLKRVINMEQERH